MGISSLLLRVLLGLYVWAEAPAQEPKRDESAQRLEQMKRQAAEYVLKLQVNPPTELKLHEEPLLRFDNPVGGVRDGIIVMWKDGKRPAVVAQVFQIRGGRWVHECQSLARAAVSMQRDGETLWEPREAAEGLRLLSDAPQPADTPVKRLVQMRSIAQQFTATDDFKNNSADEETTRHQLRLLPTPVYRYQDPDAELIDGAIFAFVHGTDPEMFLVLELRKDKQGQTGWHYTLAPMTCWAVQVARGGVEVWSVPERLGKSSARGLYHVWIHAVESP